jgi:hypothetical protein
MKKANKIRIGVIILVCIAAYTGLSVVKKELDQSISDSIETSNKQEVALNDVLHTVNTFKKRLPLEAGGGVSLIDVTFSEESKYLKYFYKENIYINDLTQEAILNYRETWKEDAILAAKDNPNNTSFATINTTFIYNLVDNDNANIFTFEIKPSDYK